MARLKHDGYGTLETNLVDYSIMESQNVVIDATEFPNGAEVGTIVGINKVAKKFVKPTDALLKGMLVNSERLKSQDRQGLKNFIVLPGENGTALIMRNGFKFTTNTCGSTEFATENALDAALKALATTPLFAKWNANGILDITATSAGAAFAVTDYRTVPNGQPGVQFQVIREELLSVQ